MEPIKAFTGRIAAIPTENIDTDQIIPSKYLKVTDKSGMAEGLFSGWRYGPDGTPNPDFVLNRPEVQGAQVLVAGNNFGCGSSREHAPWALTGYGFKAVVSTFFADIFKSNSLKNGLLPIQVDQETLYELFSSFEEDPHTSVSIDLAAQTLTMPGGREVHFPIEPFAKHCLLQGVDQFGFLLSAQPAIGAYEAANPGRVNTAEAV